MKSNRNWWILFIVSIGVMIPFMAPYLIFDPSKSRLEITSTSIQFPTLVAHIIFAFIAFITGFLQFIENLRKRKPKLHRNLGRVYVISVFISGLLALVVTFYVDNFAKATSFLVLSIIWLFTAWKGYRTAVKKEFSEHRKWMIRSFGVTLVAVSGRIIVPVLLLTYAMLNGFTQPGGRDQMVEEVLNVNIWVGLIVNFIIVEWSIINPKKAKKTTN